MNEEDAYDRGVLEGYALGADDVIEFLEARLTDAKPLSTRGRAKAGGSIRLSQVMGWLKKARKLAENKGVPEEPAKHPF